MPKYVVPEYDQNVSFDNRDYTTDSVALPSLWQHPQQAPQV